MHRGTRASCKALSASINPPNNGIWVSDDLLADAFHRFTRVSGHTSRRHGSNVPGPLEHRKRTTGRRLNHLSIATPYEYSNPLPTIPRLSDLTSWAKSFIDPTKSIWRDEPPRWQPPSPPSSRGAPFGTEGALAATALDEQSTKSPSADLARLSVRGHVQGDGKQAAQVQQQNIPEVVKVEEKDMTWTALDTLSGVDLYAAMSQLVSGAGHHQNLLDIIVKAYGTAALSRFQALVLLERCGQSREMDVNPWCRQLQTTRPSDKLRTALTNELPGIIIDALQLVSTDGHASSLGDFLVASTASALSNNKDQLVLLLQSLPTASVAQWGLYFVRNFCAEKGKCSPVALRKLHYKSFEAVARPLTDWFNVIHDRLRINWDLSRPEWASIYQAVAPYCEPAHLRQYFGTIGPMDASRILWEFWKQRIMTRIEKCTNPAEYTALLEVLPVLHKLDANIDRILASTSEGLVKHENPEFQALAPFLRLTILAKECMDQSADVSGMVLGLLVASGRWDAFAWYAKAAHKSFGVKLRQRELVYYLRHVPMAHAQAAAEVFMLDGRIPLKAVPGLLQKVISSETTPPERVLSILGKTEGIRRGVPLPLMSTAKTSHEREQRRLVNASQTAAKAIASPSRNKLLQRAALLVSKEARFSSRVASTLMLKIIKRLRLNGQRPSSEVVQGLVNVAITRPILAKHRISLEIMQDVLAQVADVQGMSVALALNHRIHDYQGAATNMGDSDAEAHHFTG